MYVCPFTGIVYRRGSVVWSRRPHVWIWDNGEIVVETCQFPSSRRDWL